MQCSQKFHSWLPGVVAVLGISTQVAFAQQTPPKDGVASKVGNVPVADVLRRLGARLEQGATTKELDAYANHFERTDSNRDGKHTRKE